MAITRQSEDSELAPFRLAPRFVSRVWGYRDLRPWYDYVAEGDPVGEVWLTGDDCLVASGPHSGKTLSSLFAETPELLLGAGAPSPESLVACGLKPGVTIEKVEEGIHDGTLESSLNLLEVAAGEMIFVDAGTVHAIWPGSILLETQQNCDLTYRMYDYGRPRELHIEKSLEAARLATRAGKVASKVLVDRTVLVDSPYFRVERMTVLGSRSGFTLGLPLPGQDEPPRELSYLFAAAGAGRIVGPAFQPVDLPTRGIVAIPAASPEFAVEDLGGLDLIRIAPKWPGEPAGQFFPVASSFRERG